MVMALASLPVAVTPSDRRPFAGYEPDAPSLGSPTLRGRMDKLERLTNLLLVLLEAPRALTMREIVDQVEGYPEGEAACRQTFERDKRTLREEGVPLETVTVEERGQGVLGYRVRP